jgi:hypothetical protein
MTEFKRFCKEEYIELYEKSSLDAVDMNNEDDRRRFAQKKAIKETAINAFKKFPNIEPNKIWKNIYASHVNRKTGISDETIIKDVISADSSWRKSSGHAFEEIIKEIGNKHFSSHGIKILLQKDLNLELNNENVLNEPRDIIWLKQKVSGNIFDLYLTIEEESKLKVFGCLQTKTSIRERVARDREPSMDAMKNNFLSIAIVLDGEFLRMQKFINMVNGNSAEYVSNGWHYMYVITNENIDNDRIRSIDTEMQKFINDCIKGAHSWETQRQWLDNQWIAD